MPSTVYKGCTGSDVVLCQERLNAHGYTCGVDGIFGNQTEATVIAFQTAEGLAADGIVGPQTWGALLAPEAPYAGAPPASDLDTLSLVLLAEIAWYVGWDYGEPSLVAQPSRLAPATVVWRPGQKTNTVCCVFLGGVVGRTFDATANWTADAWSRFMVPASDPWGMINECVEAGIAVPHTGPPQPGKRYLVQAWSNLDGDQVVPGISYGHQWIQWEPDLLVEANSATDEDADGISTDAGAVAWRHRAWADQSAKYDEIRMVELTAL